MESVKGMSQKALSVALIMAVSSVNPGLNVPGTWQGPPLCLSHEGAKGCVTGGVESTGVR